MKKLDMKDIAILDAFPLYDYPKTVLEVGCGDGKLDFYLAEIGFRAYGTDLHHYDSWKSGKMLGFYISDIFDLSSFPTKCASVVICSQVLEHLSGYKTALVHLLAITKVRLIITVPYCRSFFNPGHINFWADKVLKPMSGYSPPPPQPNYKDIHEFVDLCAPYSVAINKIRTKPEDVEMGQWGYLIVVDKRQNI